MWRLKDEKRKIDEKELKNFAEHQYENAKFNKRRKFIKIDPKYLPDDMKNADIIDPWRDKTGVEISAEEAESIYRKDAVLSFTLEARTYLMASRLLRWVKGKDSKRGGYTAALFHTGNIYAVVQDIENGDWMITTCNNFTDAVRQFDQYVDIHDTVTDIE